MWDPLDVAVITEADIKSLVVATRESRVTNTIFIAMIGIDICAFAGEDLIDLEDVEEIIGLNRHAQSSYVFEGGPVRVQMGHGTPWACPELPDPVTGAFMLSDPSCSSRPGQGPQHERHVEMLFLPPSIGTPLTVLDGSGDLTKDR